MENSETVIQKIAASGGFREAVIYERFQLKLFDWENAGVLDKSSVAYQSCCTLYMYTWRFDIRSFHEA